MRRFRFAIDFAGGEADDQTVRRLPVRPFAGSAPENEAVPILRWRQCFRMPCHFVCLLVVTFRGFGLKQPTKKPGTFKVGRAFA